MEMWQFPSQQEGYGAAGALCKMADVPSGGGGTMVYFSCEDCATEAGRVKGAGGQVLKRQVLDRAVRRASRSAVDPGRQLLSASTRMQCRALALALRAPDRTARDSAL
jgi:predicted enzyme related to lactoylglutathione lyase